MKGAKPLLPPPHAFMAYTFMSSGQVGTCQHFKDIHQQPPSSLKMAVHVPTKRTPYKTAALISTHAKASKFT